MDRIIDEQIIFQYSQYRQQHIEATNVTTTVVEPEARIIMKGNLFHRYMIVGILAIRLTGRGIERFELLGLEFLVGYRIDIILV